MPRDPKTKKDVKDRLDAASDSRLLDDNLVRDAAGNITQVICWVCHTPVGGFVDDSVVSQENVGGQVVQRIRQKFQYFNNVKKGRFKLNGGEKYEPVLCKDCVEQVDPGLANKILARDISLYEKREADDEFLNYLLSRSVTGRQ